MGDNLSDAAKKVQALAMSMQVSATSAVSSELFKYTEAVDAATKEAGGTAHSVNLNLDPLAWWKENEATYPRLAHVARSLLAVQATSAASERLFSQAGLLSTAIRNRLSAESIEMSVILRSAFRNGVNLVDRAKNLSAENRMKANQKRRDTIKRQWAAKRLKEAGSTGGGGASSSSSSSHSSAAAGDAADDAFGPGLEDGLGDEEDWGGEREEGAESVDRAANETE